MPVVKKLLTCLSAAAMVCQAGLALAAGPANGPRLDWSGQAPHMVDLNNDGIADWVQNQNQWQAATRGGYGAWLDANHDGIHDAWQGSGAWQDFSQGRYGSWIDADGNGICDNFDLRPQDGTGNGFKGGK